MLLIVLLFFSVVACSLLMTLLLRTNPPPSPASPEQLQQYASEPHHPSFIFTDATSDARVHMLARRVSAEGTTMPTDTFTFLTNSSGKMLGLDEVREVLQSVSEDQVDECQALLSSIDYDLDELRELENRLMMAPEAY